MKTSFSASPGPVRDPKEIGLILLEVALDVVHLDSHCNERNSIGGRPRKGPYMDQGFMIFNLILVSHQNRTEGVREPYKISYNQFTWTIRVLNFQFTPNFRIRERDL